MKLSQLSLADYNQLDSIPVINQDLSASGFTPIANTYYKHTGATTASYTNGVIYYYNSTGYAALDGSAVGLAKVAKTGSYNDLLDKPTIPTDYVPNTRKVNNKALSSDITLGASDVGALPTVGGTVTGNLTVGGNLTVNGTTTTVDSTTLQVKDKLIEVAHGNTATLTTPAGLVAPKYDGTNSGALVFDSTGTAYVGDVTLKDGNIDVNNSDLQPLATRTGLVGGNLVQYDSSAQTLKDSGKKISDLALKTDIPTNYVTTDTTQTISGEKTFVSNIYISQTSGENVGITWQSASDNTNRGIFRHYDDGTTETFVTQSGGFLFRPLNNNNTKSIKVDPKIGALYPEQNAGATLGKESQRWNDAYIQNSINLFTGSSGTPNVNVVNTGLTSGTNPTATKYSNLNFGEVNGKNLSVVRNQVTNTGRTSTDLWTRSFGTNHGNYVGFFASPNAKSADTAGVWHFSPNLDAKHDLGNTNLKWRNLYCVQGNISANNNPSCNLIDTGLENGTNPTVTRGAQVIGRDKNNLALTGWRGWVSKEGYTSSHLYARSFNTDYANYVALYGKPNAPTYDETSTETKNSTGSNSPNIWYFAPATKNNVDLGASNQRWNNGYITNLQLCKVINGGGGNSLIQQNSDTNGADITVGSTGCPLKLQGKNARPVYRQGKGSYNNIALQSDIPIPFDSNDLSTGTYRSTNLPSDCSLVYIEDRQKGLSGYLYKNSGAMVFYELYFITSYYTVASSGKTTLVIYKLKINGTQVEKTYKNLFVSSNGSVEVSEEYVENGTFYYKVLK